MNETIKAVARGMRKSLRAIRAYANDNENVAEYDAKMFYEQWQMDVLNLAGALKLTRKERADFLKECGIEQ